MKTIIITLLVALLFLATTVFAECDSCAVTEQKPHTVTGASGWYVETHTRFDNGTIESYMSGYATKIVASQDNEDFSIFATFRKRDGTESPHDQAIVGIAYSPTSWVNAEFGAGFGENDAGTSTWRMRTALWIGIDKFAKENDVYIYAVAEHTGDAIDWWEAQLTVRTNDWLNLSLVGQKIYGGGIRCSIKPRMLPWLTLSTAILTKDSQIFKQWGEKDVVGIIGCRATF